MSIRIGGVYNSDIISFLRNLDIKDYKFDLRPRSFNFVPLSVAQDIFLNNVNSNDSISICFEDDSKLTIEEVVEKIKGSVSFENIYLEFYSSLIDIDFLDSFGLKYYLHITSNFDVKSLGGYKNLKTIIIHNKDLEQLFQFNQLDSFMNDLNTHLREDQYIELHQDWDEEVISNFIDLYKIRHFSFDISSKVESSYRNINKELLEKLIKQKRLSIGEDIESSTNE